MSKKHRHKNRNNQGNTSMSEETKLDDAALASALSGDTPDAPGETGTDGGGAEVADSGEQQAPAEAAAPAEPQAQQEQPPTEEEQPHEDPDAPPEEKKDEPVPPEPEPAPAPAAEVPPQAAEKPAEQPTPPPPPPEPVKPTPPPPPPAAPAVKAVDLDKPTPAAAPAAPKVVVKTKLRASSATTASIQRKVETINKGISDDLHMHTPAGRQLIRMFDEYKDICAAARKDDEQSMIKAAYKLYDIMVICCPRNGNQNAAYYAELINIVFKKLTQGYGSLFKDSTLFRMDYRLPTPQDSMKFDTFYTVMYQLVSYAKTGAPISFNNNAVGKVLQSTSALNAILNLRRRLEAR